MDPSRDATAAYLTLWRFQVPEENVLVFEAAGVDPVCRTA